MGSGGSGPPQPEALGKSHQVCRSGMYCTLLVWSLGGSLLYGYKTAALSLEWSGYNGDFDLYPGAVVDMTSSASSGVSTNLNYTSPGYNSGSVR